MVLVLSANFVLFLAVMVPLYHYQHKHPHNFVYLGLFTLCLSFSIGVACANTQGWFSFLCKFKLVSSTANSTFYITIICVLQGKLCLRH